MPLWTLLIGCVVGAVLGSFLNMVIYRLPRGISFVNPSSSICPTCKAHLGWVDLVPLFSWLSTGGKCRYCKAPVAARYFLVEVLTGALFAGAWYAYQIQSDRMGHLWFVWAMLACLVAVVFIDWELYIIPDELNAVILLVGLASSAYSGKLVEGAFGALTGWGIMFFISFVLGRLILQKDALGDGDIKLMRGVGAMLGPLLTPVSVVIGVFAGLVIGVALMVLARRPAAETENEGDAEPIPPPESLGSYLKRGVWYLLCLDIVAIPFPKLYRLIGEESPALETIDDDWEPSPTAIPFGPYLAIGAVVCLLGAQPITELVQNYFFPTPRP
ncbi:MAG: prepilin peptidase [Fimbriimonadaceae bacterium]|nr:prepilin peptidase [Fimbriimonadaceae bacterium]